MLPSGFAGDAARAWLAAREGIRLGPVVRAIVCDRIVGLLVLIIMVSVTFFALPHLAAAESSGKRLVSADGAARDRRAGGLVPARAFAARLLEAYRATDRLASSPTICTACSFAGQAQRGRRPRWRSRSSSSTWRRCTGARGACASIWTSVPHWSIVPAVMLVSMAPISFAGWGVREGAMIVGLGLAGIAAADALAVSVPSGCCRSCSACRAERSGWRVDAPLRGRAGPPA